MSSMNNDANNNNDANIKMKQIIMMQIKDTKHADKSQSRNLVATLGLYLVFMKVYLILTAFLKTTL